MANNNAVITLKARENMVRARAGELVTMPKIIGMAFGDGGCDAAGEVLAPTESQGTLRNETLRKEIDGYTFLSQTTCRYECTLTESELAGGYISEIGLYDENGDIVCIKSFRKKGKDDDLEMTFTIDDIF